jgi:hypothetical protein
MESSPFVSFSDSESVITLERAMSGSVLAANIALAPPIKMSRLVKFPMFLLLPRAAIDSLNDGHHQTRRAGFKQLDDGIGDTSVLVVDVLKALLMQPWH